MLNVDAGEHGGGYEADISVHHHIQIHSIAIRPFGTGYGLNEDHQYDRDTGRGDDPSEDQTFIYHLHPERHKSYFPPQFIMEPEWIGFFSF